MKRTIWPPAGRCPHDRADLLHRGIHGGCRYLKCPQCGFSRRDAPAAILVTENGVDTWVAYDQAVAEMK
jgi:hypothetical protein